MSEWIDVNDRLPEPDYRTRYLVYGTLLHAYISPIKTIQFCTYHAERGFEYGEYDHPIDATHWMPLPLPPPNKENHD